ncbi:helix-turn-helix transcriptional regulator [Flavobacterium urocaniciphilum]|uniref:Helix-turn-helix n=1 Tax=Flavobacterium urocaniciphilum TaxID=1299341 RepID=A0A1H9CRM6_9FLAO|nr:helix-turn-helix transcriptional regulator [Flavobacterium urocaniciphilum]SEQ03835.1 Helix-turn-helix [Flavobacterium urocaniciphilum]
MSNQFGNKVKELRVKNNLFQKHLANALNIDTPLYSKIERGERKAKKEQIPILAKILKTSIDELTTVWLADQVLNLVKDQANVEKVLKSISNTIKKK